MGSKVANVVMSLLFVGFTVVGGYYATREKSPFEPPILMIPGPACPYTGR